jgi:hypothetical protein
MRQVILHSYAIYYWAARQWPRTGSPPKPSAYDAEKQAKPAHMTRARVATVAKPTAATKKATPVLEQLQIQQPADIVARDRRDRGGVEAGRGEMPNGIGFRHVIGIICAHQDFVCAKDLDQMFELVWGKYH